MMLSEINHRLCVSVLSFIYGNCLFCKINVFDRKCEILWLHKLYASLIFILDVLGFISHRAHVKESQSIIRGYEFYADC